MKGHLGRAGVGLLFIALGLFLASQLPRGGSVSAVGGALVTSSLWGAWRGRPMLTDARSMTMLELAITLLGLILGIALVAAVVG